MISNVLFFLGLCCRLSEGDVGGVTGADEASVNHETCFSKPLTVPRLE